MPINNRQLDNGITLISEPVAATKAAAIGFWFYTGSREENANNSGITHFIEHMLFKGTGNHSARDIARFFDRTGGYINAFTDRENVCLYAVVPGAHASDAFKLMMDMLTDSTFAAADIETERSVIESEILSYLDDPEESCAEWFMQTSFNDSGLSLPIAGTVESLGKITPKLLRSYHRDYFIPRLSCVTVSGSFDSYQLTVLLENYPTIQRFNFAMNHKPNGAVWNPGKRALKTHFSQSQISVGWKIPDVTTTEEWFDWSTINDILSDTVSSRLFQELREERGLCYSITGTLNLFRDCSFLGVNLSVPPEKTMESVEALNYFTRIFFESGPTRSETIDAISRETGAIALASEDPEYRMKRLARQYFRENKVRTVEEDLEIVNKLSIDRLKGRLEMIEFETDRSFILCSPGKYGKLFLRSK